MYPRLWEFSRCGLVCCACCRCSAWRGRCCFGASGIIIAHEEQTVAADYAALCEQRTADRICPTRQHRLLYIRSIQIPCRPMSQPFRFASRKRCKDCPAVTLSRLYVLVLCYPMSVAQSIPLCHKHHFHRPMPEDDVNSRTLSPQCPHVPSRCRCRDCTRPGCAPLVIAGTAHRDRRCVE